MFVVLKNHYTTLKQKNSLRSNSFCFLTLRYVFFLNAQQPRRRSHFSWGTSLGRAIPRVNSTKTERTRFPLKQFRWCRTGLIHLTPTPLLKERGCSSRQPCIVAKIPTNTEPIPSHYRTNAERTHLQ